MEEEISGYFILNNGGDGIEKIPDDGSVETASEVLSAIRNKIKVKYLKSKKSFKNDS